MYPHSSTKRGKGAILAVAAAATTALSLTLISLPAANAAGGATLSKTSGPLGTVLKVTGTCTDLLDGYPTTARIRLYFPDAFETVAGKSYFHEANVTASTAGAFSGSIKVGPAVSYTKVGAGPAAPGATVLRKPKAGDVIKVQVACNQSWTAYPISFVEGSKAFTVTKSVFTLSKNPKAKGKAEVGKTLTAKKGTWSPTPSSYSFQWKRGSKNIAKATKSTYKVKQKDEGKKISVVVKGKKAGYVTKSVQSKKRLIG